MGCLPALEEATRAGLLEAATIAGEWRFSHALVRDALEARIPLVDRVALHRQAAEAIEQIYAGQLEERAADLARHWAVVATTGEGSQAVRWARLGAEEAMRLLAFEEGARLYRMALDAGGASLDDEGRAGLLLDLAHAEWRSGRLDAARATCTDVVEIARRTNRGDLLAEAALALEPIGSLVWDLDLALWCRQALAGVADHDVALRSRLLARLTEASVYAGEDRTAEETSAIALELADASEDGTAVVAALRARQLAMSGPEHVEERTVLAVRMVDAASCFVDRRSRCGAGFGASTPTGRGASSLPSRRRWAGWSGASATWAGRSPAGVCSPPVPRWLRRPAVPGGTGDRHRSVRISPGNSPSDRLRRICVATRADRSPRRA